MLVFLFACAPNLAELHTWDDGDILDTAAGETRVLVETKPAGVGFESYVDASDPALWVGLDFDAGALAPVEDGSTEWDVRFKRFGVSVNGGISGDQGGEATFQPGIAIGGATDVPTSGWVTDELDGPDEASDPDYALHLWFDYNDETHILTPAPGVWFVRATSGSVYALEFHNYYNEAGDSGYFTFSWTGPIPE